MNYRSPRPPSLPEAPSTLVPRVRRLPFSTSLHTWTCVPECVLCAACAGTARPTLHTSVAPFDILVWSRLCVSGTKQASCSCWCCLWSFDPIHGLVLQTALPPPTQCVHVTHILCHAHCISKPPFVSSCLSLIHFIVGLGKSKTMSRYLTYVFPSVS